MKTQSYFDALYELRNNIISDIIKAVGDKSVTLDDNITMSCGDDPFNATLVRIKKDTDGMLILIDKTDYEYTIGDVYSVDDLANLLSSIVWATSTTNKNE